VHQLHTDAALLAAWTRSTADGLTIVGVHTPSSPSSRDAGNVASAIRSTGLRYPSPRTTATAPETRTGNHYWPPSTCSTPAATASHELWRGRLSRHGAGDPGSARAGGATRQLRRHGPRPARSPHRQQATPETYPRPSAPRAGSRPADPGHALYPAARGLALNDFASPGLAGRRPVGHGGAQRAHRRGLPGGPRVPRALVGRRSARGPSGCYWTDGRSGPSRSAPQRACTSSSSPSRRRSSTRLTLRVRPACRATPSRSGSARDDDGTRCNLVVGVAAEVPRRRREVARCPRHPLRGSELVAAWLRGVPSPLHGATPLRRLRRAERRSSSAPPSALTSTRSTGQSPTKHGP